MAIGNVSGLGAVEQIVHEREFKILCDGLLRFEVGPLVQTFSAAGPDRGIDAEYTGKYAGSRGRWVFQYKFVSPGSAVRARQRLKSIYCPASGRRGEFDCAGVKGAAGYVLLTNVPVSVALVDALRNRWDRVRSRSTAPFVVWDASCLNAMLKGREHLARSWSGEKEKRCTEEIVRPLWQWVMRAVDRLGDAEAHPLWPLLLGTRTRRVQGADPLEGYANRYERTIDRDDSEVRFATSDPHFHFARHIAYPVALAPLDNVRRAATSLLRILKTDLESVRNELLNAAPHLIADEYKDALTVVCFGILEMRWGFATSAYNFRQEGKVFFSSSSATYACGDGIEAAMRTLVGAFPHGQVPSDVTVARAVLKDAVSLLCVTLWYPHELGIDAEVVHETVAAPRPPETAAENE